MKNGETKLKLKLVLYLAIAIIGLSVSLTRPDVIGYAQAAGNQSAQEAPAPLLAKGHPVAWWFVFKFNASAFPGCGGRDNEKRACPFGGEV